MSVMAWLKLSRDVAQPIDISHVSQPSVEALLTTLDDNQDGRVDVSEQEIFLSNTFIDNKKMGSAFFEQEHLRQAAADTLTNLYRQVGLLGRADRFAAKLIKVEVTDADRVRFLTSTAKPSVTDRELRQMRLIFSQLPRTAQIEVLNELPPPIGARLILADTTQADLALLRQGAWDRIFPENREAEKKRLAITALLHCCYDDSTLKPVQAPDELHDSILSLLQGWTPGENDADIISVLHDSEKFPKVSGAEIVVKNGVTTIKVYLSFASLSEETAETSNVPKNPEPTCSMNPPLRLPPPQFDSPAMQIGPPEGTEGR